MEKKNDKVKRNVTTGASASLGAAAGVVGGSFLTGELRAEEVPVNVDQERPDTPISQPHVNDDEPEVINSHDSEIRMATSVDDNMSFSEAFAAARAEVGPGGAFEWRGNLYGTYYATEWNSMTPEQKAEYYSHFNWGASNNGGHVTPEPHKPPTPEPSKPEPEPEPPTPEPEYKIEAVRGEVYTDNQGNKVYVAYVKVNGHIGCMIDSDGDGKADKLVIDEDDNGKLDDGEIKDIKEQGLEMPSIDYPPANNNQELEVEVLSVETVTDEEGNTMDVANVRVEGHEGLIVDGDRDGKADVLLVDFDDSGEIDSPGEFVDITDQDVQMASLVPQSQDLPDDVYYAQNDPDYVNNADVSEYLA